MKYCLRCRQSNDDGAVRCCACGSAFFTKSQPPEEAGDRPRQLVCSGCRRYISDSGLVCPHCGFPVQTSITDAAVPRYLKLTHSSGWELLLSSGDILGRDMCGGEFFSSDPYVSASHLRVRQMGKYFELQDISGGNSFFCNGRPVEVRGKVLAAQGDRIILGLRELTVSICLD